MKYFSRQELINASGTFACLCAIVVIGVYFSAIEEKPSARVASPSFAHIAVPANAISAKAAIIYDPATGAILYAKNIDDSLPLASLTKLMSAEAVLSTSNPSQQITVQAADLEPAGDSGLRVGDRWSLKNILTFGLIESSNDAMTAAAAAAGNGVVEKMNQNAQQFGFSDMHFYNPTGLDVSSSTAGGYGSARDVARLAADFMKKYPSYFDATVEPSVTIEGGGQPVRAVSTSAPILDIPGLVGSKTGYTDLAGGNLVTAFDVEIGHPLIVAVLGSTYEGRFSDMRTLITAARDSYASR